MRRLPRLSGILLLAAAVSSAGCLSLGGKTTFVAENAETTGRIASLESPWRRWKERSA